MHMSMSMLIKPMLCCCLDLPSIVSGSTVAFLDPHEKYFVRGEPGQAFSTEDPLLAPENFDQFEPFHQMFGCNLNQGNCYSGTLFRFPLRTQPSQLSNKIYTRDMVETLFDSFKNEASAILLFLKNVDSISCTSEKSAVKFFICIRQEYLRSQRLRLGRRDKN